MARRGSSGPLPLGTLKPRPLAILISIAGACPIGLLIYGVSNQAAKVFDPERRPSNATTALAVVCATWLEDVGMNDFQALRLAPPALETWASGGRLLSRSAVHELGNPGQMRRNAAAVAGAEDRNAQRTSQLPGGVPDRRALPGLRSRD